MDSPQDDTPHAGSGPRTPITVLTGALGAGKTTLLRYILEKPHGYRIAVIQNEFSEEMGIESPLITDAKGETVTDIYELPNGCLCCSAKDGLVSMLDRLLENRQRFDYILVEATGVADPESICEIFWVDEGLGCHVYLDSVVTLVDGRNVLSVLGDEANNGGDAGHLGLEREAAKQIACADVLIFNKLDLTPETERIRVKTRLTSMNPAAVLLESVYAAVPLNAILGIRAFDRSRLAESMANLSLQMGNSISQNHHGTDIVGGHHDHGGHDHGHSHQAGHDPDCDDHGGHGHGHSHQAGHDPVHEGKGTSVLISDHGIESVFLRGHSATALYDPDKVRSWMAEVLWEDKAGGVYRCKGLFQGPAEDSNAEDNSNSIEGTHTAAQLVAYALQGVGKLFDLEAVPHISVVQNKFLFIGRGLQSKVLEEGLHGCLWHQEDVPTHME